MANASEKQNRNYIKYREFVLEKFKQYLRGEIDNATLNQELHTIQSELGFDRQRGLKAVWFKFTKDDNLCHTINEIWSDLKFGTQRNQEYLKELMQLAIDNPKHLKIYYS
jgi:hypothetical protein